MFGGIQAALRQLLQRYKIGLIESIIVAIQLQLGPRNQTDWIKVADVTVL